MLFGKEKNKDLLIDFINKALPYKKVIDIQYLHTNLDAKTPDDKKGIVDVVCTDKNGSKYIIEMQNSKFKDFSKRCVYYSSKIFSDQIYKGRKYGNLSEVICISITNYVMFPNKKDFISIHKIMDIKTYENDLTDLSFAFIELPKFKKNSENRNIDEWCDFLINASTYKSYPTNNPIIRKAYKILEKCDWTPFEKRIYESYKKEMLDKQAIEDELIEQSKIKIAQNLINVSNLNDDEIFKVTELSKQEVMNLRHKI